MKINKANFQKKLLEFNNTHAIKKPWESDRDPYKIWLLEVLSQQTRMDQAMPYYERILASFPNIKSLADAQEDELFSLWKGLGYYSRARNLHSTAKYIAYDLKGCFPATYNELLKLKGVGSYTAAAIASFAYREDVSVLDGNVHRVLSRIFGISKTIQSSKDKQFFQDLTDQLLITGKSDLYNQAMMNFGSYHCKPQNPLCDSCGFSDSCIAYANNAIRSYPPPKQRPVLRDRYFYCLFVEYKGKYYLRKRTENDIWKGLYEGIMQEGQELDPDYWKGLGLDISKVMWSDWQIQTLSHQRVRMKIGLLTVETTHLPAKDFKPKTMTHILALPRIISKWWNYTRSCS